MKDKSLADIRQYELHWLDEYDNEWVEYDVYNTKKEAKREKEYLEKKERRQKQGRVRFKYRLVKCVTKKEVVK
jgi:hypothetical protein